jgi:uncharacterized damage-inducible protein DinB
MAEKTITEKDQFLNAFGREVQITTKVLKAYPPAKGSYRPHPKSRTATELAWNFVIEQAIATMALKGKIDLAQPSPPAPPTFDAAVAAFEKTAQETMNAVSRATEGQLNATVQFPVGPGKMADLRAADVLWMMIMDQIHHRGQLSVYLRLVDAKVPSIYGPTADETWM